MKNIMIIRSGVNIGGPGSVILATIRELKKRGYKIVLVCGGGEKVKEIKELNVICYIYEFLQVGKRSAVKDLKLVFELKKVLIKHNIDTVYGFNSAATLMAYIASKSIRKKIYFINALLGNGKYWFHNIMPFRHICMSEEHKKELVKNGMCEDKLRVNYPSTLDEDIFNKNVKGYFREELGLMPDDILVGTVMNGKKGNKQLGSLVLKICSKYKNVHYLFVGNSSVYNEYKSILLDSQYKNRIHFVGVRNDIPEIMYGLDILSHLCDPTEEIETFGMVLTEAMIMNTAVVASYDGGMKEIVENNDTGFLVTSNDEYIDKMEELLENPLLLNHMKIAGEKRAKAMFTIQQHIDKFESYVAEIGN